MYAFLSYQTNDKLVAGKVHRLLERLAIPSSVAHDDIEVSTRFEILKRIRKTDIFIPIISQNYYQSVWCMQESGSSVYETYFGRLKSPIALRFFRRFPLPHDLSGQDAVPLSSIILGLANGKIGPHKGRDREKFLSWLLGTSGCWVSETAGLCQSTGPPTELKTNAACR